MVDRSGRAKTQDVAEEPSELLSGLRPDDAGSLCDDRLEFLTTTAVISRVRDAHTGDAGRVLHFRCWHAVDNLK